jgi:hypothetical protein
MQSVKAQSVKAPICVPPAVPRVQTSKAPSVVPSEALHVQSCAPSQWHMAAPFAMLPRVSSQTPILPGVSLEASPSEFPMGVPYEALLVHAYSAPPEVLNSQSCAPGEGPSELPSSSVPPEALPAQSSAPSKGPSEIPSSAPSEAPLTPSSAPSEAPLHPEVSPGTPQAEAVVSKLRPRPPVVSPSACSSAVPGCRGHYRSPVMSPSAVPCSQATSSSASLGAAPFTVPAIAPTASSSAAPRVDSPSSSPRAEPPDQGNSSSHDLEALAESGPSSSHSLEPPATSPCTSPSDTPNSSPTPTYNSPSARLIPNMVPLPEPSPSSSMVTIASLGIAPSSAFFRTLQSSPPASPFESSLTQRPTPTSLQPTGPSLSHSAGIPEETSTPEWVICRIAPRTCWISCVVMERLSA